MYQKLLKQKKKHSKKQHYGYHNSVVVKYLFCFIWVLLMQPVMTSVDANDFKWDSWDDEDDAESMKTKISRDPGNEQIFETFFQFVRRESASTKGLKYDCIDKYCSKYIPKPKDQHTDEDTHEVKEIARGDSITLKGDLGIRLVCDAGMKLCVVMIVDIAHDVHYSLFGYDYKTKETIDYFSPGINTEKNVKPEKNIEVVDRTNNSEIFREVKSKTEQKHSKAKSKYSKNLRRLVYFVIAFIVVCGFLTIYLLLNKNHSVENVNEEENEVETENNSDPSEDETYQNPPESEDTKEKSTTKTKKKRHSSENEEQTDDESAPEQSSQDYTPILVRDSYYEEHGTNSLNFTETKESTDLFYESNSELIKKKLRTPLKKKSLL